MKKGEYGYDLKLIRGEWKKLYYLIELSTSFRKAYIFTRFSLLNIDCITSGERSKDPALIRQAAMDMGITKEDYPPNCNIHHDPRGRRVEFIPKDIHESIGHLGVFGVLNRE